MHWTLDTVRALDTDDFDEVVDWLRDRAKKNDDGIDADDIVDAKDKAQQQGADGR